MTTRTHYTRTICHLDGRKLASAGFTGPDSAWPWISQTVADECECSPDDVHILETDEGDVLTVDGMPVYKLFC